MAGQHTLRETETAVAQRLSDLPIDMEAMAGVGNVYRAAGSLRNHFERTVLAPHELTWTGWVVLWVVWVWSDIETRLVAAEAGISKGTLTGVVTTLQARGLLARRRHPDDRRRVLLTLTPAGTRLMRNLFPAFNAQEALAVSALSVSQQRALAVSLRKVIMTLETLDPDGTPPQPRTVDLDD